uniref:Uncharacterized protein n=1 Tax=Arundo donax TaxID=35708 RepID=A0A0A9CYF1_ARUDO
MGYGADRDSTPPRGGRLGYCGDRDLTPPRGGRTGYGGDRDPSLPRGGRTGYGGDHDPPGRGHLGYDDPRDMPGRGRRDYGDDRDGSRRGPRDYGRVPYRDERDRSGRGDRDASGSYEAPPEYMHPDHPSNLGRPSLRAGKKESYFGGPSDWSLNRDSEYFGGPGRRSINKERELFGDDGMTLRISATESGRTSALYQDRRSPPLPPQAVLSPPPPPLYPSVLPIETGLFTGGSAMEANDGFGAGSTRLLRDDGEFKYHEHLRDPYVGRGREIGRNYLGNRDALVKEDVGTERLFCAGGAPVGRDRETERLYSSRRMLGSGLVPCSQLKQSGDSSSSLLAKDQPYGMHSEPGYEPSNGYIMDGLGRPSHDSLGHGSGHGRLSGSSLEHGSGRGDEALLDITRQVHSKHALRAESMEYDAHDEYGTRDPINGTYVAPENLHGSVLHNLRHMSGSASLRGLKGERINHHLRLPHRMEEDEDSFQAMRHDTEHNVQHSYDADAPIQYPPARGGNDRHSHSPGTEPIGIARQPARQHEFASFEDLSDQEVSPMVSRKRYRSPAYSDDEMDMYQVGDGFTGRKYYADDMDAYDLSPSRMSRSYDMVDDGDEYARYEILTSRNVFSRLALPDETIGEWTDVDQGNHPHAKMLAYERPKHKPISQRLSRPFAQSQFGGPSMYGRGRGGGGMTKSAKKETENCCSSIPWWIYIREN